MPDIELIREDGGFYTLRSGDETVRICGCCGKRIDGSAAAALLSKIQAGELSWRTVYALGRAAEEAKQ